MSSRIYKKAKLPLEVVDLTFSVWEAFQGNYFLGQTNLLTFGNEHNAWAALLNPPDSGINLFWNVYTLSNFSSKPFVTEVWLNSVPPEKGTVSKNVASANQSATPPSKPKVELQYGENVIKPPSGGIYSFTRMVEPNYTLTRHDFQGMIILPPGGSAITYLKSPTKSIIKARVAFGWWETNTDYRIEIRS